ncbi:hypothetical protein LCGC14_1173260 [marine sediment metagenome]|uniref:Uncharacterized protein n=1 Tax=marine sediment metagenome TaxID=412755 RepID=A0A0F9MC45_9ZZZZ
MNGGMTECGQCDCDPCCCEAIAKRKQEQRIKDGKEVIYSLDQANRYLTGLQRFLVKLLWPDVRQVLDDLRKFKYIDNKGKRNET